MPETGLTFFTGPILIGTQLNWCLLGLLAVQVYFFSIAFPDERRGIKILVYTLFFIDLFQTGCSSAFAYAILVANWGNPAIFITLPWTSVVLPFTSGLISVIVQHFFVWRIYVLKGNHPVIKAICVLISLTSLMQGLSAMVNAVRFAIASQLANLESLIVGTKVWLGGAAACDCLIALTMIYLLSEKRRSVPWKKTDSLITKLIVHTVETGAVTTIAAAVELALFVSHPENFMHEVPVFILGKLYTNVVLATLNARWRSPDSHHHSSGNISSVQLNSFSAAPRRIPGQTSKAVTVDTVVEVHGHDTKHSRDDF